MNREIKFRGVSVVSNKFVHGSLISLGDGYVIAKSSNIVGQTSSDDVFLSYSNEEVDIVFPDAIGQYTGLQDKNGKEIYEGDIVKVPLLDPIFGDIIKDAFCNAEIRFNKGSFVVSYYGSNHNIYLSDLYDKIEVIGNIYDNKELLKNEL